VKIVNEVYWNELSKDCFFFQIMDSYDVDDLLVPY
jgi:hypothetical protein